MGHSLSFILKTGLIQWFIFRVFTLHSIHNYLEICNYSQIQAAANHCRTKNNISVILLYLLFYSFFENCQLLSLVNVFFLFKISIVCKLYIILFNFYILFHFNKLLFFFFCVLSRHPVEDILHSPISLIYNKMYWIKC